MALRLTRPFIDRPMPGEPGDVEETDTVEIIQTRRKAVVLKVNPNGTVLIQFLRGMRREVLPILSVRKVCQDSCYDSRVGK